jgi:AcrR family transcriptional regulator
MSGKPVGKKRPPAAASRSRRGVPGAASARNGQSKVDRRQQLTAAALRLFSKRPYDDVSIDDIAAEAGVAHGLLSYYFGGKRGIYLAALETVHADLRALTRPLPSDGDVAAQMKGMARRHFEYFRAHPHLMLGLLNSAPTDAQTRAILEANQNLGAQTLVTLLDLPHDPPPALETALRGVMGYLDAVTVHWLTYNPQLDIRHLVDLVHDVAMASVVSALGSKDAPAALRRSSATR